MSIRNVGVIGAGTMGNGIAQVSAVAGMNVVMVDITDTAVNRGVATITQSLDRLIKKEKLTVSEKEAVLDRIKGTTKYSDLAGCFFIVEAATENQELKLTILRQIDQIVGPDTIVATNTSSISITKLASVISNPQRFIGTHFFNPVPVMGLIELISGLETTAATFDAMAEFAKALGKTPIKAKNRPGFIVNRVLCPMINEAVFALQEGLGTPEDIDAGMMLGCNHPIGPLALADLIGLDTLLSVMDVFYKGFNDSKYRPAPLLQEMVDAGFLGRKSGRGFYHYNK